MDDASAARPTVGILRRRWLQRSPAPAVRGSGGGRVGALDSLRGIAALIVVINHCALVYGWAAHLDHPGIRLLVSGDGAVILFFVLSGLVLSKTFIEKDRRYIPYAVKRVVRIYLPFAVVVLAAAALSFLLGQEPVAGATPWFNLAGWHSPVTWRFIAAHLAMGHTIELDNAIWSLFHEMRISLLLPALAIAVMRHWPATIVATLLFAGLATLLVPATAGHPLLGHYLTSVQYVPLFAAGAVMGLKGGPLVRKLEGLDPRLQLAILVIALLLLTYTPPSTIPIYGLRPVGHLVLCGVGSVVLMAFGLGNAWLTRHILNHPIATYFGWISYSLYLVHLVVLEVLVRLMDGVALRFVPVLLTIPVSILLAHAMRATVEDWAQNLGRFLAKRMSGRIEAEEPGFGEPWRIG